MVPHGRSQDREVPTGPSFIFLCLLIIFHLWFRDLLRELNKKYEILLIVLFLIFLIFIISEGLLFISFFWTSFHSLSSPSLGICLLVSLVNPMLLYNNISSAFNNNLVLIFYLLFWSGGYVLASSWKYCMGTSYVYYRFRN